MYRIMYPKTLVLSGGGPKGIALIGAMHYLDTRDYLRNVENYWGTSVGSIICLLFMIGYTPIEIFQNFFINEALIDNTSIPPNIFTIAALCNIETIGSKVSKILDKKLGKNNFTFKELNTLLGKTIHIIGTNIDNMCADCFDHEKTPNMSIKDAIEISCDLPFIFTPKKYNGYTYIDGGFINNYPINMADNKIDEVLGICIFGPVLTGNETLNILFKLMQIPLIEVHRERIKHLSDKCLNIELSIDNMSLIELAPNINKRMNAFSEGVKQISKFFEEKQKKGWDIVF